MISCNFRFSFIPFGATKSLHSPPNAVGHTWYLAMAVFLWGFKSTHMHGIPLYLPCRNICKVGFVNHLWQLWSWDVLFKHNKLVWLASLNEQLSYHIPHKHWSPITVQCHENIPYYHKSTYRWWAKILHRLSLAVLSHHLSHHLQGFIRPRWLAGLFSVNNIITLGIPGIPGKHSSSQAIQQAPPARRRKSGAFRRT